MTYIYISQGGKEWQTTLVLSIRSIFGFGEIHRLYTGHIAIGIVQLLTGGGCGIWQLIDFINILQEKYQDADGNIIMHGDSMVSKNTSKKFVSYFLAISMPIILTGVHLQIQLVYLFRATQSYSSTVPVWWTLLALLGSLVLAQYHRKTGLLLGVVNLLGILIYLGRLTLLAVANYGP